MPKKKPNAKTQKPKIHNPHNLKTPGKIVKDFKSAHPEDRVTMARLIREHHEAGGNKANIIYHHETPEGAGHQTQEKLVIKPGKPFHYEKGGVHNEKITIYTVEHTVRPPRFFGLLGTKPPVTKRTVFAEDGTDFSSYSRARGEAQEASKKRGREKKKRK